MSEHSEHDGADAMDFAETDFEQMLPALLEIAESLDELMAESTDRYRPFTINIEIEFPTRDTDE